MSVNVCISAKGGRVEGWGANQTPRGRARVAAYTIVQIRHHKHHATHSVAHTAGSAASRSHTAQHSTARGRRLT